MDKRIKKAAAIVAAAVLCLSMSMSVFAAESVEDPVIDQEEDIQGGKTDPEGIWFGTGTDKDGNRVTVRGQEVSKEVEEILKDEQKVKDILTGAGYDVPKDSSVILLGMGDMQTIDTYGRPIDQEISDSAEMTFPIGYYFNDEWYEYSSSNADNLKDLKNGDTVYLLHQKSDGTWEVIEGKIKVDTDEFSGQIRYSVVASMTGFSPIGIIKVMSDGRVVVLDKNENVVKQVTGTGKTTAVTDKKSPKTGE